MSLFDYQVSKKLVADDVPFYGLIMAAMRKADTDNLTKLIGTWPNVWIELNRRYKAGGGYLNSEEYDFPNGCGPSTKKCECRCAEGGACEHKWDGEVVEDELSSSTTCSRCGMTSISHSLWVGE